MILEAKLQEDKQKSKLECDKAIRILNDTLEREKLELEREKLQMEQNKLEKQSSKANHSHLDRLQLPMFDESKDQFDCYLERFEHYAKLKKIPPTDWAVPLSMSLSGETLEALYGLPQKQQSNYYD